MKKILAISLALVMVLLCFAGCGKEGNTPTEDYGDYKPVEKFDGDKLKETWSTGEITFANKNKITLPCTIKEFLEASGLRNANEKNFINKQYKPGETFTIPLSGEETQIKIDCENLGEADCSYEDVTVVGFNYFNSANGNRAITVAAGLTVGVSRAEVEDALGIPEGKTSEDRIYTYTVKVEKIDTIRMSISFNSNNVVNSISYDLIK